MGDRGPQHRRDLFDDGRELHVRAGLDVQAEQRLGVALADVAPPALVLEAVDGNSVVFVDVAAVGERLLELFDREVFLLVLEVALAGLGVAGDGRDHLADRLAASFDLGAEREHDR